MKRSFILYSGIFISILIILSGCVAHKNSYKTKSESVIMTVKEDTLLLAEGLPSQEVAARGLTDEILGKAVTIAAQGIKKLIEADSKRYTAEYSTALTEMYFYSMPSEKGPIDPEGMQFSGYNVLRTAKVNGKMDTAFYMSVSLDTTNKYDIVNNSIFRLELEDFVFNYAKAKVTGYRWYLPWTLAYKNPKKNKIDMDVTITITGTWINEQQQMNKDVELGKFYLTLRDMPIDKNSTGYKEYFESLKGTKLSGMCFLPIRSYGYYYNDEGKLTKCWGQGIYSVWVSFKEAGKENKYLKLLRDNSGAIIDGAEKNVNKKKEE
jgi:hypothetical protein